MISLPFKEMDQNCPESAEACWAMRPTGSANQAEVDCLTKLVRYTGRGVGMRPN